MRIYATLFVAMLAAFGIWTGSTASADAVEDDSMEVIASKYTNFAQAGVDSTDVMFEFAGPPHAVNLRLVSEGSAAGTAELFVIQDGVATPLFALALDGTSQAQNMVPSDLETQAPQLRVVITTTGAGDNSWSLSRTRDDANFVEHGRRKGWHGCSTDDTGSTLIAVLAVLAFLGVSFRVANGKRA